MLQIKKRAFTETEDTVFPLTFSLSYTCSGTDITLLANGILGGVAPYVISTNAFTDSASALANTDWTSGTSRTFDIGNLPNTYWVVIRDDVGTLTVDSVTADCWDSLDPANRENGFVSLSGTLNSTTACGFPTPTDAIYVAVHTPNMLAVGDRVFEQGTGTTFFNGSTQIPPNYDPMYWKLDLQTEVSGCTTSGGSGTRVLIDKNGFITELYCCP